MTHAHRLALVTGAARGIGAAIARRLSERGHETLLVDRSDPEPAADALRGVGLRAHALTCDVSAEAEILALFETIERRFGRLDVLVNNAGLAPRRTGPDHDVAGTTLEDWQAVMAVNLTSPFLMCRSAIPLMARGHFGRIVNVASRAARTWSAGVTASYAASKAGLVGFSRSLAGEVGALGITVNCVAPSRVVSAMTAGLATSAEEDRKAAASTPVGRVGRPDDIAAAVAWLASEEAAFVTGAILDVTGGQFMPA